MAAPTRTDWMAARALWDAGVPVAEIATRCGVRPATVYGARDRYRWPARPDAIGAATSAGHARRNARLVAERDAAWRAARLRAGLGGAA